MQSDYVAAWQDYRKRTITLWVVILSYLPGVGLFSFAVAPSIAALTGIKPDSVTLIAALCWMTAFSHRGHPPVAVSLSEVRQNVLFDFFLGESVREEMLTLRSAKMGAEQ